MSELRSNMNMSWPTGQGLNSALLGWHARISLMKPKLRTYVPGPSVRRPFRSRVACRQFAKLLQVADCRWAGACCCCACINNFAHLTRAEGIIDESNILIVQIQQILTVRLESAERFCCERHLLRFEADLSGGESSESGTTGT